MNNTFSIPGKLFVSKLKLEQLLSQIKKIDEDMQIPISDKVLKIKIIKDEIDKIGQEIDIIKKEITISDTCNIN